VRPRRAIREASLSHSAAAKQPRHRLSVRDCCKSFTSALQNLGMEDSRRTMPSCGLSCRRCRAHRQNYRSLLAGKTGLTSLRLAQVKMMMPRSDTCFLCVTLPAYVFEDAGCYREQLGSTPCGARKRRCARCRKPRALYVKQQPEDSEVLAGSVADLLWISRRTNVSSARTTPRNVSLKFLI
jgi:hypothetical protein